MLRRWMGRACRNRRLEFSQVVVDGTISSATQRMKDCNIYCAMPLADAAGLVYVVLQNDFSNANDPNTINVGVAI